MVGQLFLFFGQVVARSGNHRAGHAEPLGNLDREAAPRRAVDQPVGGRERFGIEAERRARHAVRRRRVRLERVVVGRRDQVRASRAEVIDHRDAERAAFYRIRPGAHLVEQHQRRQREVSVHRHDVGDVRGEGAQACGNGLLVADVGKERLKDW